MKKIILLMLLVSSLSFGMMENSAWDGSVREVKNVISTLVKDPGSVTYYNWGAVTVVEGCQVVYCDFGAKNSYGGMVRMNYFFLFDMEDNFLMYAEK